MAKEYDIKNIQKADDKIVDAHELLKGALSNAEQKYNGAKDKLKLVQAELSDAKLTIEAAYDAGISLSGKSRVCTPVKSTGVPQIDYDIAVVVGLELTEELDKATKYLHKMSVELTKSKSENKPLIDNNKELLTKWNLALEQANRYLSQYSAAKKAHTELVGIALDQQAEARVIAQQSQETIDNIMSDRKLIVRSHIDTLQKWSADIDRAGKTAGDADTLMDKLDAAKSYAALVAAEPNENLNGKARYAILRKFMEQQRLVNADEKITYDHMLKRLAVNRQDLLKDSADQETKAMEIAMGKAKVEDDLSQKTAELKALGFDVLKITDSIEQAYHVSQALKSDAGVLSNAPDNTSRLEDITLTISELTTLLDGVNSTANELDIHNQLLQGEIDKTVTEARQLLDESGALGKGSRQPHLRPESIIGELRDVAHVLGLLGRHYVALNEEKGDWEQKTQTAEAAAEQAREYQSMFNMVLHKLAAKHGISVAEGQDSLTVFQKVYETLDSNYQFAKEQWQERAAKTGEQAAVIENLKDDLKAKDAQINSSYISKAVSGIKSLFGIGKSNEVKKLEAKVAGLEAVLNDHARNEVEFQKRTPVEMPSLVNSSDVDALEALYARHIAGVSTQDDAHAYAQRTAEIAVQNKVSLPEAKAIVEAWSNHSGRGFMDPIFDATQYTLQQGTNGLMNRSTKIKWFAKKLPHVAAAKKLF